MRASRMRLDTREAGMLEELLHASVHPHLYMQQRQKLWSCVTSKNAPRISVSQQCYTSSPIPVYIIFVACVRRFQRPCVHTSIKQKHGMVDTGKSYETSASRGSPGQNLSIAII